jgi:hypothetical protein
MNSKLLCAALAALVLSTPASADDRQVASRELVQKFGGELLQALSSALQEGGPTRAIEVCREQAPKIAEQLSAQSGAKVSRTSLKVRRESNAPEVWQREVLDSFEQSKAAGEDLAKVEHFEITVDGGARYMKPIVTQPLCVTCHGSSIAPDVRSALAKHYPNDTATGFQVGDIRGAFSVVWPSQTRL